MSVPSANTTTTCDMPNLEIERSLLQARQAVDGLLDGEGDLPLDFLGSQTGRDRVDLHLYRRRVRKGVDVQLR